MDDPELKDAATKQLDRILGFFARVEAKASFLFAVNSALLGTLAVNIQKTDFVSLASILTGAAALLLVALSFYFVFRCFFPNLKGGHASLVYFAQIAKLREQEFISKYRSQDTTSLIDDLLAQSWRNSEILAEKFRVIKIAFYLTGFALLPWALFLALASVFHPAIPAAK